MSKKRLPKEAIPFYVSAEEINALLTLLEAISHADVEPDNVIQASAGMLKDKILKHGRKYQRDNERRVSVYFFPSEIIPLMRIMTLLLSVKLHHIQDYYPLIGRKRDTSDPNEGRE